MSRQAMVLVALLMIATTAVFSWHIADGVREASEKSFEGIAVATSRSLANHVTYPLISGDLDAAQKELLAEAASSQISEALLYAPDGRLLLRVLGGQLVEKPGDDHGVVTLPRGPGEEPVVEAGENDFTVWMPVRTDHLLGWLKVTFRSNIGMLVDEEVAHHIVEGVLITLLAALLAAILFRRPISHIEQATEFAGRLHTSRGERIEVESDTLEIRRLVDALNRVSEKLFQQECKIRESHERLARARKIAGLGMWEWDAAEEVLYWSSDMSEVNQTEAHDIEKAFADEVLARVPEEERKRVFEQLFHVLNGGDSTVFVHEVVGEDGERRTVQHHIDVSCDEEGNVVRVLGILKDITESHKAEEAIRSSEEQLRTILDNVLDAIVTIDAKGIIRTFNKAAEEIFGYSADEAIGKEISMLMPEEARPSHVRYIEAYGEGTGKPKRRVGRKFQALRKDGTLFPAEIRISDMHVRGELLIVGIIQDITVRKQAEENMRLSEQVFANSVEGIVVADANRAVLRVNYAFTTITGFVASDFAGQRLDKLFGQQMEEALLDEIWHSVERDGQWKGEVRGSRKNGESYLAWMAVTVTRDEQGKVTHYIVVINDITEIKEAQTRIHHLVNFDALTNLPNRSLFQDRLAQGIAQASRTEKKLALLRIDLDRFKNLNETMGHASGDLLLQKVAERLVGCVRKCDTVARLSGDEFAVMLTNFSNDADVIHVSRKVLSIFEQPFDLEGPEVYVTASIGVSIYPNDGDTVDELVTHAGAAMHHVKEHGRNAYRLYTDDLDATAFEHLVLENSLRRALEREEFVLFYQPQIDLGSGRVVGVEALIRWKHPDLGMVSPAQFIPLLEETGLILSVGQWVLQTACRQAKQWRDEGLGPIRMAINLSPRQIDQSNLVEQVAEALELSGLDPRSLDLEITESCLMGDVERSTRMLHELRQMDVNISIDDFGTGYSSLNYLTRFPIDTLKIDRSFVKDVTEDADDASLAKAIISMGHSLKLKVLAEGVETPEQLEFLRQYGCDEVQGFLFSMPLPADEVTPLLASDMRSLLCAGNDK